MATDPRDTNNDGIDDQAELEAASQEAGNKAVGSVGIVTDTTTSNRFTFPTNVQSPQRTLIEDQGSENVAGQRMPVTLRNDNFFGNELLDKNNRKVYQDIVGNPTPTPQLKYIPDIDSMALLYNLDYETRVMFTDLLQSKGFFGGSKPSPTRLDGNVEGVAVSRFLSLSNSQGRTYDYTLDWIQENLKTVYGGGTKASVTPTQDVKSKIDDLAIPILGRKVDPEVLKQILQIIKEREQSGDKTSINTMVETQISKSQSKLEQGNRFAKGVDIFRSMLGGN